MSTTRRFDNSWMRPASAPHPTGTAICAACSGRTPRCGSRSTSSRPCSACRSAWAGSGSTTACTPSAVLGHSLGEYAAACLAGVFSLAEGLQLVTTRARLMQALETPGGMLVVRACQQQVRDLLAGGQPALEIAALNGPRQTVVSGAAAAVQPFQDLLDAHQIGHQRLATTHAFHCALVEPILEEFAAVAQQVTYAAAPTALLLRDAGHPRHPRGGTGLLLATTPPPTGALLPGPAEPDGRPTHGRVGSGGRQHGLRIDPHRLPPGRRLSAQRTHRQRPGMERASAAAGPFVHPRSAPGLVGGVEQARPQGLPAHLSL